MNIFGKLISTNRGTDLSRSHSQHPLRPDPPLPLRQDQARGDNVHSQVDEDRACAQESYPGEVADATREELGARRQPCAGLVPAALLQPIS